MLANNRAANWHRWFAGDAGDARGRMGWPGRYAAALGNAGEIYNYYSTGDEVFHETPDPPWLLAGMDESTANYCWQKQETLKGSRSLAGTAYGGWGFNVWLEEDLLTHEGKAVRYSPEGAAAAVVGGSITNRPVFDTSDAAEMRNPSATEDYVFLALAKHVPALSSPVGGTNVTFIVNNIDMNFDSDDGGVFRPNKWGRGEESFYKQRWLHSDMKDMAYFYVFKLYDQLIQKGNLK